MRNLLLILMFFAITTPSLMAETPAEPTDQGIVAEHPIDVAINKLLDADPSTHGQIQALGKGYELWDAELNKVYQELMHAYGKNQELKKSLKTAQLAWIKFRDAEFEHLHNIFLSKEGTMYRIFLASDRMTVVKNRALELKTRYDNFTDSN